MYDELYRIWKREFENSELQALSPDFFLKIADYSRSIREEGRMLDKRTMKANLLKIEMLNVKRMATDLVRIRYKKLVGKLASGGKIPSELLAAEEARILDQCLPILESYRDFAKNLPRGQILRTELMREYKHTILRFSQTVPEIIGADMKTYGPFRIEDVASLPVENAKILIKQHLAEKVQIN